MNNREKGAYQFQVIAKGGGDFTWNLVGLVDFQPWKHVSLFGGYRILDVDYEIGSGLRKFKYDVLMQGPMLGLNIIW